MGFSKLEEPEGVVELNSVLFRRYVQTREPYQPWLVAFVRNGSKKCAKCIPYLHQVAEKSYGFMFVGIVDQDKEPLLVKDFEVEKNWTVFLFNKNGHQKLTFPCDPASYYRHLVDNLPQNAVLDADPTWLESSRTKPSAILFTSRFKVPNMWRAIGGFFQNKGLRIGLVTEQEYIEQMGIRRLPAVVYMNSSGSFPVQNVQDYKTLRLYLNNVRHNKPPPVKIPAQRFFLSSQFKEVCKGDLICVVMTSRSIDPRFALREERFPDEKIRFFSGSTDLPHKFMKTDEIWIFNGDGKRAIPVDGIQDLDDELKFVLKGAIKWSPIEEFYAEL